ncbi:MAG: chemotaxis protein CheW [Ignavibacteria bacterium]|nr:chemotaxis protein CheW [Ignavibacteria bacterium]
MKQLGDLSNSYILFELHGTVYAIKSSYVKQMEMVESITPVPNAPEFVEGVVFIRGKVIPVINLRKRFGFPAKDYDLKTRLIVLKAEEREIGLIVDSAREFVVFEDNSIQPVPDILKTLSDKFLSGYVSLQNKSILILNIEALLNLSEQTQQVLENKEIKK